MPRLSHVRHTDPVPVGNRRVWRARTRAKRNSLGQKPPPRREGRFEIVHFNRHVALILSIGRKILLPYILRPYCLFPLFDYKREGMTKGFEKLREVQNLGLIALIRAVS